jgi:hypothetical protein
MMLTARFSQVFRSSETRVWRSQDVTENVLRAQEAVGAVPGHERLQAVPYATCGCAAEVPILVTARELPAAHVEQRRNDDGDRTARTLLSHARRR